MNAVSSLLLLEKQIYCTVNEPAQIIIDLWRLLLYNYYHSVLKCLSLVSIAERSLQLLCRNLITKQPGAIVDSVVSVSPNDALASFQRSNGGIKTHLTSLNQFLSSFGDN